MMVRGARFDIAALRADFTAVASWMVGCDEWNTGEAEEVGLAIKAAIETEDAGYLAWWSDWLAAWAAVAALDVSTNEAMYQAALNAERAARGLGEGLR